MVYLQSNSDVIWSVDKGNTIIVLDEKNYIFQINALFQRNSYGPLNQDPTAKIGQEITCETFNNSKRGTKKSHSSRFKSSFICGFPKTHKLKYARVPITDDQNT